MWYHHKNSQRVIVVLLTLVLCLGCTSVLLDESLEDEIVALREDTLKIILEKVGNLSNNRTFCCKVHKNFPLCLVGSLDYPYTLGLVGVDGALINPDPSSSHDVVLGEKVLSSILNCTADDVVYLGMLRKREVRFAGLAWFGRDGSSFAGIVVLTEDSVYFIYTSMYYTDKNEASIYDIFWAEPPYYHWRNPYVALRLLEPTGTRIRRMRKKSEKMYRDRASCSDFNFDNFVPAFRIDISPDEFPKVRQN